MMQGDRSRDGGVRAGEREKGAGEEERDHHGRKRRIRGEEK